MRAALLMTIAAVGLAGCQSGPNVRLGSDAGNERKHTPATEPAPTTAAPQVLHRQVAEKSPQPEVQPIQYVAAAPAPLPEPLEPTAPRPARLANLTLADLEQMALAGNPSVARAAALVQAARGNYIQAGLPPNPIVGYDGQQVGSGGRAEQDGVFVEQEFVRGGKLRLNRQVAAQEWARREQELAAQHQRVLTDVRMAFYAVLIAQLQEEQYTRLVDSANTIVEYNERLQKVGERSRGEVIQVTLERERYRTGALNSGRRRLAAWRELAAVVGRPEMPPGRLEGSPDGPSPNYEWDAVLQRLLTTSPEVAAAMANIERARWARQRALVEQTPNVTVQGLFNVRDEGIGGGPDGAVTIGLPLPLWNRNQGGIVQAQGEVAAAERALDQLQLDLQQRLAPVFERYSNARNYAERYQGLLQGLTEEWQQLNERLRAAGEWAQLDVILFQRSYAQTQLDYLDALREQRQAEAEIEGLLLSKSLSER